MAIFSELWIGPNIEEITNAKIYKRKPDGTWSNDYLTISKNSGFSAMDFTNDGNYGAAVGYTTPFKNTLASPMMAVFNKGIWTEIDASSITDKTFNGIYVAGHNSIYIGYNTFGASNNSGILYWDGSTFSISLSNVKGFCWGLDGGWATFQHQDYNFYKYSAGAGWELQVTTQGAGYALDAAAGLFTSYIYNGGASGPLVSWQGYDNFPRVAGALPGGAYYQNLWGFAIDGAGTWYGVGERKSSAPAGAVYTLFVKKLGGSWVAKINFAGPVYHVAAARTENVAAVIYGTTLNDSTLYYSENSFDTWVVEGQPWIAGETARGSLALAFRIPPPLVGAGSGGPVSECLHPSIGDDFTLNHYKCLPNQFEGTLTPVEGLVSVPFSFGNRGQIFRKLTSPNSSSLG